MLVSCGSSKSWQSIKRVHGFFKTRCEDGCLLTEHTETTVNFNRVCFMAYESYPNMNTSRRENIQRMKRKWEEWTVTPADRSKCSELWCECRSHRNPRLQQNGSYSNYHWNQGEHAVMSAVGWGVKRPARAERGAHLELLQQCRQEWDFQSIRQRARGWPQNLSEWRRKGNGQQLKWRSLREDSAGKQGLSLASHWRCLML